MPDFPINIKVDPGDAPQKIDRTTDSVAKLEKHADSLKRAFAQVAEGIRYTATVLTSQAVRGFGSLADAIQLEHKWLVTLRGDMQAYQRDLAAIDALHRRGTITAREHAAAMASARSRAGIPTAKQEAGLLDGALGQAAAFAGPAALAVKAFGAISASLDDLNRRARDVTEASAAMLRYRDTAAEARESAEGLRGTAKLLGEDLKSTAGVFLDVAGASSDLGLSATQLTSITRTLGMIMKTEGRSIGDVGGVLSQLEFAISRGSISSGELARIMKQFPPIAATWRQEFGLSTAELLKAADSGEIARRGLSRLLTSFEDGGEVIRKYQQRLIALADTSGKSSATILKDQLKFVQQHRELEKVAKDTGVQLESLDPRVGKLGGKLRDAAGEAKKLHDGFLALAQDPWADKRNALAVSLDLLTEKASALWTQLHKIAQDPWGGPNKNMLAEGIDLVVGKLDMFGTWAKKRMGEFAEATKQARAELERLAEPFARMQRSPARAALGGDLGGQDAYQRYVESEVARLSNMTTEPDLEADMRAYDAQQALIAGYKRMQVESAKWAALESSNQDGIARGFNAIDRELHNTAQLTEQLLVGAFHNLEDAIVQAATTGELSFSRMIDGFISDLTRLALRQAALGLAGLFGPGGTPSVFGTGATQAFSGLYGSAGLDFRVPGFSAGGEGTVRGGGGMTDAVPVAFWATQGERVIVQTQGQQAAARDAASSSASSPPPVVPVVVTLDERAFLRALQSPLGATAIDNVLRKNPGLLKR